MKKGSNVCEFIKKICLFITFCFFIQCLGISNTHVFSVDPTYVCTEVYEINVGYGLAIVSREVWTDGVRHVIVIDAGQRKYGDRVVDLLRRLHINKVDQLFISHDHPDHVGGLPAVVESFPVGKIYLPPEVPSENSEMKKVKDGNAYKNAQVAINKAKEKGTEIVAGAVNLGEISEGKMIMKDLTPPFTCDPVESSLNHYSRVLYLRIGDIKVFLPGDAPWREQKTALGTLLPGTKFDIISSPHHGNDHANPAELYDNGLETDGIVVVSCSEKRAKKRNPSLLAYLSGHGCQWQGTWLEVDGQSMLAAGQRVTGQEGDRQRFYVT
jgi:beta-lactamase superfamily II metal-dependent hydrolase